MRHLFPRRSVISRIVARNLGMIVPVSKPDAHVMEIGVGDTYREGKSQQALGYPQNNQTAVAAE